MNGQTIIADARRILNERAKDGMTCPCCNQLVKIYKRKLNANMVRFLIDLVLEHHTARSWVSYLACRFLGRDYNYLQLFGLAKTRKNTDKTKKSSGMWKPTEDGINFVAGRNTAPEYVKVYNNRVIRTSKKRVTVREALQNKFNYDDLMKGR